MPEGGELRSPMPEGGELRSPMPEGGELRSPMPEGGGNRSFINNYIITYQQTGNKLEINLYGRQTDTCKCH
jgi:hypothetical protein